MLKREKELMFFGLNPDQKSYEGLKLFVIIYIGVALFAGALSSPIYWLVQWIDAANSTETTRWLLGKRLDVYFNRISYAGIIIMLPYMMKRCGLFSVRNLGLGLSRLAASRFAKFFALGVALSASIFACQYAFCDVAKSPEFALGALPKILAEAILGGVLLALLEEVVFRALIMRCFYTAWGPVWAIVCGALFFSYKHFGTPNSLWDELAKNMTPTWDAGFIVAWYDTVGIAWNFTPVPFLSLTMFGAVLCLLYIKTKSLWTPIALHAGIVFAIQVYRNVFSITVCENTKYFGGAGMTNGYMAFAALTAIFIALCFWKPREDSMR